MKAIRVNETGGPDKLRYEDVPVPVAGPGQARVRLHAIGVNFIDVYHRTGLYPLPLPFTPGMEGAGIVEEVGEGVTEVAPQDRVAYAMAAGSYAEYAVVDARKLVRVPEAVDFRTAAAAMLQGMTAHYLAVSTFPLRPGETALIHAAAGGVGLLLTQVAKIVGATVIGTVSSGEKAELARAAGADHIVRYDIADFESEVGRITGNRGVHVVYDSVGKTTFDKSLNCLRPRGMLVLFGQSSGPVNPVNPAILAGKGSLYLTRPSLAHYTADTDELAWRAREIFGWHSARKLAFRIDRALPLSDAGRAHELLESRQTKGKVLLIPGGATSA